MENSRYKFRAWNKRTAMMEEDFYIHSNGSQYVLAERNYDTPHIEIEKVDLEIMQYTGLVDKHGFEIYEGDIVKNIRNGISRKVYWDTHCASFHLSKRGREKSGVEYWSLSNPKWNYEVIGNIYENSDLLEG